MVLDPCEAMEFVKGVLPLPDYICTRDVDDALAFLRRHGRIVLKAVSPKIVHKWERGAVVLDVTTEEELEHHFYRLLSTFGGKVMVQEQVSGAELFLGAKKDPQFGPVVLFGLGGIFVELYEDVSIRAAPVDTEEALEMVNEIKGRRLLEGFRGHRVNKEALARLIAKFSRFVYENVPEEMDVNPLIARGDQFWAVDVRVVHSGDEGRR